MKPKVRVYKIEDYEYDPLRQVIFDCLERLSPLEDLKGRKVIVKPNLLSPATPETAILTHPFIVRAVTEYFLQHKAVVQISDSPAMGSFQRVLTKGGFKEALEGLGGSFVEFKETKEVDIGKPFGKVELSRDVLEADLVVNLPKLKTHTQMLLTLAVKNLFGTVVGARKPEWHFRTGVDRMHFARLLVRIAKTIGPKINILDGVWALEGQGPGKRGTPKHLGLLMASDDPFAIDWAVCRMIGLKPEDLLTLKVAIEEGIITEEPEIEGQLPEVRDFQLPEITSLVFGPSFLRGFLRRHLTQRPTVEPPKCTLCG
ncbi:MAG: DUF362 domain-containing protein, partial [Nitrospirae bacterium]